MTGKDSLLPRSLFSASTLKIEPLKSKTNATTTTPNRIVIDSEEEQAKNTDDESSSSSSDNEEEDDLELETLGSSMEIHSVMNTLMVRLERQQARQARYFHKVKQINRSIRKTNRMVMHQANLLLKTSGGGSPQLQLAKRSSPLRQTPRPSKQRKLISEDEEEEEDVVVLKKPAPKPTTPSRPLFPVHRSHRNTRNNVEFNFGADRKMDIYTMRKKNQELMSSKKPRSLLYNIADTSADKSLSEIMITTSLDGELQFWNAKERRKIKTIGQDHLYDTWIDDICWATPSTLAFCPPQKSSEPVKLIHIGNVSKNNVEGRIQTLTEEPHENGIAVIASLDTGSYPSSRDSESCSFVTGGYDKSVYLWNLTRNAPTDNFTSKGVHRLNIKHTAAVYSLCYDQYKNVLFSGGADERLIMYDVQSSSTIRELRLSQRVSQIVQSKANPNIMLITTTNRADQFCIYDQRTPGFDGIKLRFGQHETETLSRFIRPDMHENGYMVCCGGHTSSKLNFWDLRYQGVSRSTSFGMDTQGITRSLRSMFIPGKDTLVSLSSSRLITWIDYNVQKDEIVKTLT